MRLGLKRSGTTSNREARRCRDERDEQRTLRRSQDDLRPRRLPEEERRDFEDYLAAHPERQAEIDELGAVAGLLAFSPHELEPPEELRSRIMEVGRPRQRPAATGDHRVRKGGAVYRRRGLVPGGGCVASDRLALVEPAVAEPGSGSAGPGPKRAGSGANCKSRVQDAQDQRQIQQNPDDPARGIMGRPGRQRRSRLHRREPGDPGGEEHAFGTERGRARSGS